MVSFPPVSPPKPYTPSSPHPTACINGKHLEGIKTKKNYSTLNSSFKNTLYEVYQGALQRIRSLKEFNTRVRFTISDLSLHFPQISRTLLYDIVSSG